VLAAASVRVFLPTVSVDFIEQRCGILNTSAQAAFFHHYKLLFVQIVLPFFCSIVFA
jgi:hypothetical protein